MHFHNYEIQFLRMQSKRKKFESHGTLSLGDFSQGPDEELLFAQWVMCE